MFCCRPPGCYNLDTPFGRTPLTSMYAWVKTTVGSLLAVNLVFPLYTVVSNRHLWDEPMAVLAGNMSGTCTLFGLTVALIGVHDLVELKVGNLCQALQYSGAGLSVSFKMSEVCMAVDQYAAVIHPLHHYQIMTRLRPWLLAAIWLPWAANFLFGFFAIVFDMETFADSVVGSGNGSLAFPECRWESGLASVYTYIAETQLVTLALTCAGLFTYTAVVGHLISRRLRRQQRQQRPGGLGGTDDQKFLENYRAFKKVLAVLSLTVTLDVAEPMIRVTSRWYPMPQLHGLLHQARLLGGMFEGWAYGLLNAKLRAAYRKTLCGKADRAAAQQRPQRRVIVVRSISAVVPSEEGREED